MRKFSLAIIALSFPLTSFAMSLFSKANAEDLKLELDSKTKKQGEFFQATVRSAHKRPRIWFNTREFKMYEILDHSNSWKPVLHKHDSTKAEKFEEKTIYRALIPVENMTKPGTYSVLARLDKWEERIPVEIKDNGKGVQQITLDETKSSLTASAKELNEVGSGLRAQNDNKFWQGKFIYPSDAPKSSPFGVKRSYNKGPVNSYHKGLDFAAEAGAPVVAPADGEVVVVGYEKDGYNVHGNTVIIDHGHSITSIYMHLSKVEVKHGDKVKQGDKIGEVGHTGISTGPHLHWGVYAYGTSVEPELFVSKEID